MSITALIFLAILGLALAMVLLCVCRKDAPRRLKPAMALDLAGGRTIVVGEHHADRKGLLAILRLMEEAHLDGYRTLGLEICRESRGSIPGFDEELAFVNGHLDGALEEYDALSYLSPRKDETEKPRVNRQWQMQLALKLGWDIVPIDPHHWEHLSEDERGYFDRREPAMSEEIRKNRPMVAVVGCGHLAGLDRLLGGRCLMVNSFDMKSLNQDLPPYWTWRLDFARQLPKLVP